MKGGTSVRTAPGLRRRSLFTGAAEALEPRTLLSVVPAADNAPPQSSGISNVTVDEDAPDTIIDLWAVFSDDNDPDEALSFSISNTTPTNLFRALAIDNKAGTLTLRYAPNANGNASVVVRATDTQQAASLDAFNVTVRAINDAPVNRVPSAPATLVDTPLVFGQQAPGGILVNDVDLAVREVSGNLTVTLLLDDGGDSAHGTLTLPSTTGLQFLQGDGQADTRMSFAGTGSAVNRALSGLRFDPAPGFTGTATLTITSDDQGNTGAGGALTDTDSVPIQVVPPAAVSVGDARVLEGNSGMTAVNLTVSLAAAHPLPVSVHWSTADGTAHGGAQTSDAVGNGGFESPAVGLGWSYFPVGSTIGPWVVESGSVDVVAMWQDAEGSQSLDLTGSVAGAVYQDVPTVPGQAYVLRFALAGNPEVRGPDRVKLVAVDVNGSALETLSFDTTGRTLDNMGWEYHEYAVTATSTTTRVRFTSLSNQSDTGPAIDDVRLIPAGADDDYRSNAGVVSFAPGETTKTVTVFVNGDTRVENDEAFFVDLSDPSGATLRFGRGTVTVVNDDQAAPRVTQVSAASPQWPQVFKDRMAADGLGSGTFGFAIPGGPGDGARLAQLAPLPWQNVNQVSIRFDADVVVAQDDLDVRGDNVPQYTVTAFVYDEPSRTATWTVSPSFSDDRIQLELGSSAEDGVHAAGAGGAALDGEWNNEPGARPAQAYPSGDGVAGGDFRFKFNVLPGDVNGTDDRVTALDAAEIRRRLGRFAADHVTGGNAYSVFADLNTDGRINALDLAAVRKRLGHALPVIESAPAAPVRSAPAPPPAPIAWELLAQDEQPVLS